MEVNFHRLLSDAGKEVVNDEDGDPLPFEMREGATNDELRALAESFVLNTPDRLDALLCATNGGSVWCIELVGTNEMTAVVPGKGWIPINNWGNGDFDWVVSGGDRDYEIGKVVFFCHESGRHAQVAESIDTWLVQAMDEIRTFGSLAHPYDYRHSLNSRQGIYRKVYEQIKA